MKLSNEELVSYAYEALEGIESAISELNGIEEYKDILIQLENAKSDLENEKEPYEKALVEEERKEQDYMNSEYERNV